MKKLIVFISFLAVLAGCKKDVDYSYPMELVYLNETEHSISLTISSDYTPIDIVLEKGGRYSRIWASGFGPNYPPQLTEAKVTFDDKYTVFHRMADQPGAYHNVCNNDDAPQWMISRQEEFILFLLRKKTINMQSMHHRKTDRRHS